MTEDSPTDPTPQTYRQRCRELEAKLARTKDEYTRYLIESAIEQLAEEQAIERGERL